MPKSCAVIVLGVLMAASLSAQPAPPPLVESITVMGSGHAAVTPDRFSFTAGVQTNAPTVDAAVSQNNTTTAAVVAALGKAGATDRELRTSGFYVIPQMDYGEGRPPRVLGYQVSNNVTVTKTSPSDAGRLMQVAITAGANQLSSLDFSISDPARGRDEGLKAAFADARSRAATLAQAAGRTLGRALQIGDAAAAPIPRPMFKGAMAAQSMAASDVPVEAGQEDLAFSVTVTFELK